MQCEYIEVERDEKAIKKLIKAWNEFEKTYKDAAPDEEWLSLSENIAELTERKKQIEGELQALKDRAIAKAAGVEMKVYGLTVSKTERKESYDYKAFCEHTGAVIPCEYLRAGSVGWRVTVS